MKLDNYELSTIHYTIGYYIDNANLDEDENEWLNLLKEKVDSIMMSMLSFCLSVNLWVQFVLIYSILIFN